MSMVPTWWTAYGPWPAWSSGTGRLWRLFCCRRVNHTALLLCRPVVDAAWQHSLAVVYSHVKGSSSSHVYARNHSWSIFEVPMLGDLYFTSSNNTLCSPSHLILILILTLCLLWCCVMLSLVIVFCCLSLPLFHSLCNWRPVGSGGRSPFGAYAVYCQTGCPGCPSCGESAGQEGEGWEAKKQMNTHMQTLSLFDSLAH